MTGRGFAVWLIACACIAAPAAARERLLVGNKSADTVWVLDAASGERLAEIPTGVGPHEIATRADGRIAVVTDYGRERPGHSLTVIDLEGGATRSIDLGAHGRPHGLRFLPGDEAVLVTTEQSGTLVRVDLGRGVVDGVAAVGEGIGHMVAVDREGRHAYVSKIRAGTVVRVDLASMHAVAEAPAGAGAEGIEVAPDGRVWVTNRADDTVTVHDPTTLAVAATLPSAGFPIRVVFTPDGRHALVTNATAATLAVFDTASLRQVASVQLAPPDTAVQATMLGTGPLPIGAIVHPGAPRAYVAISGADRVAVVDTTRWEVTGYWATGREPDALGIVGVPVE
ncbi:YncE family protein [Luteimonas deserti]|uniref:YncE family protein n=1 Tax=Luteimonas deserti TaxID=2752306 RepID=A0A7Z0QVA1_9GAMM|nr:YncE family protein [Luteimonas deserti]NYZ64008.1 YncE family protein [Luteimonas deserti]